jgi:hypothetical protein
MPLSTKYVRDKFGAHSSIHWDNLGPIVEVYLVFSFWPSDPATTDSTLLKYFHFKKAIFFQEK